jgi:DNA-binding winged helix-turn-helix (wHTH) protein
MGSQVNYKVGAEMPSNLSPAVNGLMEPSGNAESGQTQRYIRFGPFRIDQQRQRVCRNGTRLRLEGRVYQVLLALLARAGQIVTREELKQAVWPRSTYLNFYANVNTAVSKLRRILGDSADRPVYIETIPRKGYSFLFEPEFSTEPFPVVLQNAVAQEGTVPAADSENTAKHSNRWVTFRVITLIAAGVLIGVGLATLWISRFAPHFSRQ